MKFRFRFSLRTLLLTTLFAGSVLLCWNAREAWAFKKFSTQQVTEDLKVFMSAWSTRCMTDSGRYLLVNKADPFNAGDIKAILFDLKTGHEILVSKRWIHNDVHPKRDWVVQISDSWDPKPWQLQVIEISSQKVLFCVSIPSTEQAPILELNASFSTCGNKLIVYSPRAMLRFYEVNNWKQLGEIPLTRNDEHYCLFDDNKKVAIYQTSGPDTFASGPDAFGGNEPQTRGIKAYSCSNGQLLWNWKKSENAGWIHAILPNESTRRIVCYYRGWSGGSFQCNSISFDGTDSTPVVATLPFESRTELGTPLQTLDNVGQHSLSLFRVYEDESGVEEFMLRDNNSFERVHKFAAPNSNINCLRIDKGGQFAAGIVDNNALAIWTRRREHFAWWGIYEQPEFWVAMLFFGALFWSIRRDWAERNGVAQNGEGQGAKQAA